MNKLFVPFLPPWAETGLQPAFYDLESGTVLQQVSRMYAKVNQLIRNFNDLSKETKDTVEEYIAKFIELKDFVDDYFDNLDVQEEINNKLDAMVEAGTLQEIVAEYLNASAVWGFDNIADMQSSSNLIDGSYAQTLGYYAKNDGGGGLYKIRTITNEDTVNGGTIIAMDDVTLVAELIVDDTTSVKQFGAKGDGTTDDSQAFTNMLAALGHIFITEGTYSISGTITLHSNEYICGSDKNSCVIKYTGNNICITNEDVSTSKNISIHDFTLIGTNRAGKGIYLIRTTKDGDSYHRLYNLKVTSFEYGIYLEKNLNETQLSDIVTSSNDYGLYLSYVNDFYIERCVSCINTKNGIVLSNSTEGRISDTKAWYNGNNDPTTYYNIVVSTCTGLMMDNIGCQESYGSNMFVTYCKQVSITNCFLSLPSLDGEEHYQLILNGVFQSNIEVITANKKVSGSYINKLLQVQNNVHQCDIKISAEDDFPSDKFIQYPNNATSYGVPIKNNIEFDVGGNKIDNNINYMTNGDLSVLNSTADFANFITGSTAACSIVNGNLRVDASGSNAGINFRYPALPVKGLFVFYVAFKKVSDSGKVVVNYYGQKTFNSSTASDEILIAATYINKADYSAATNLRVDVSNAGVIDILEVGFIAGGSGKLFCPLYKNSKIAS